MKLCGGQRGRESFCSLLVMRVCVFGTVCDVTVRQGERQRERERGREFLFVASDACLCLELRVKLLCGGERGGGGAESFCSLLVMRVCAFGAACKCNCVAGREAERVCCS